MEIHASNSQSATRLDEAYLILEKPAISLARYDNFCRIEGWIPHLSRLREALAFLEPNAYRGISRSPLTAFPIPDTEWLRDSGWSDADVNTAARLRMCQLRENDDLEGSMLGDLDEAIEVYRLLDASEKNNYEIIGISRRSVSRGINTLGYDIGYWGGDFFSLICDCSVMPIWHPPDWEDLAELAEQLRKLNAHLLFEQVDDAMSFREYYRSKTWAETETEEGEFHIIRVDDLLHYFG